MAKKLVTEMSVFEQARWYSLLDAVDIIEQECIRRGKNFNTTKMSPIGIEKYIEGTCDSFARKIEGDQDMERSYESIRHNDDMLHEVM